MGMASAKRSKVVQSTGVRSGVRESSLGRLGRPIWCGAVKVGLLGGLLVT